MTIKQHGGVFGRNPVFNTVEATGDADFGSGVLQVDAASKEIGINTDPAHELDVRGTGGFSEVQVGGSNTAVKNLIYGDNNGGLIFYADKDNAAASSSLRFYVDGTEAARFNSSRNLAFQDGNGIDFSATSGTGTSELLDDYEEGTWTVEIFDAASGGNVSPTTATGTYTKIGNTVLATFFNLADIDTTGMTGASALWITVPFTASSAASGSVATDTITFPSGKTSLSLSLGPSSSRMRILMSGSATVDSSIPVGNLTSGASDIVHATITYIAS